MRLYLSGAMRGQVDHGFPAFDAAREALRAKGHDVFCPAEHSRALGTLDATDRPTLIKALMTLDIIAVSHSDAVAVLPNWETSLGATAEIAFARSIGLHVFTVEELLT